jgi:hypothetical protein
MKQNSLETAEDSELLVKLREHCSRFYNLAYDSHPTKSKDGVETEMSVEQINTETSSLIGLAGEILDIPEREPLDEQEMLAIHNLLENQKVSSLQELQKLYRRNKELAA